MQRRLTGAPRASVAEAIELLRLDEYADRRAGRLSLGNKQRLSLARALLHHPDVLVLDEPANALDPAGIVEVRELLRSLADERGVTVFMSSHILAEVAHLADRIGIVHERPSARGARPRRAGAQGAPPTSRSAPPTRGAPSPCCARRASPTIERDPDAPDTLRVMDAGERAADIAALLVGAGLRLSRLTPAHEDLETYFLRLTGGEE